jgi:uncharacterized SAM-binding protein YcdF (DUF218 family)
VSRGLIGTSASVLVRVAVLAGLVATLVGAFAVLRIWQQGGTDEERSADAIVVLGAAQYDGRPSPVFAARLEHAVDLYRAGVAPRFVVTGGKRAGDRTTEAAVAREYAIAHGVPADAIFGEDEAHNTLDSLRAVAGELDVRGLRSAVLVSDPTHMYRVLRIASDLGLEAYGSPTRTSPVDADLERRLRATAHELGALALYFATGGAAQVELPHG